MAKFIENILFGLGFGIGFLVAKAVLDFAASLISHAK